MKIQLPILTFFMAVTPAAFAWPFVTKATPGGGGTYADANYAAVQMDDDRMLELVTGMELIHLNPGAGRTLVPLPDFDHTPYGPGIPVRFEDGRAAVGDIDGDGDLDIVRTARLYYGSAIDPEAARMVTCINNGNGTWTRGWSWVNNNQAQIAALKLVDLDRDGDLDLIDGYNSVRIHWNPGNGDFSAAPTSYYTNQFMSVGQRIELEVGDFDGNGWVDIAVFYGVAGLKPDFPFWLTGRLGLLTNNGGTFTSSTVSTLPAADEFFRTACADVDRDGRLDLVANTSKGWLFYRNTGVGFAAAASISTHSAGHFELADMDEDGVLDIVHTADATGAGLMRGLGNGSFAASLSLGTEPLTESNGIAAADYDGDGDRDVVLFGGATILHNTEIHPASAASVEEWTSTSPSGVVDLTVGDLNHDGRQDLIAADGGGKRLLWYSGTGNGLTLQLPISTGSLAPASVAAGDFNGDGWTDLTWTTPGLLRQALSTNGTGIGWSFSDIANMAGITRILPGDYDLDGDLDLLSVSPTQGLLRWQKNNGDGTSWLPVNVETGLATINNIAIGQEIPGGRLETAALLPSGYVCRHRYQQATGLWSANIAINIPTGGSSTGIVMADISDATPGLETVFALNQSPISYMHPSLSQPVTLTGAITGITHLAAADWNADGHTDILYAHTGGVTLLESGSFTRVPLLTGKSIRDLVIMDLNGDHLPDAVAVETDGTLHLFTNTSNQIMRIVGSTAVNHLVPMQSAELFEYDVTNHGKTVSGGMLHDDAFAAPSQISLRFRRATFDGTQYVPSATMLTQTEVNFLIDTVSLEIGGNTVASASSGNVNNGIYHLTLSAPARAAARVKARNSARQSVRVRLKNTASISGLTSFFVEFMNYSPWVALDGNNASGPSPLALTGTPETRRSLITINVPAPLDTWRYQQFGSYDKDGAAANDADPDRDGVPNLVEYFTGTDPEVSEPALNNALRLTLLPVNAPDSPVNLRVYGTTAALANPDLRVTIQSSTGGLDSWSTFATRTGGGSWTGTIPSVLPPSGGRSNILFATSIIPAATPKFFARLKVEELP